ncbi:MAG: hypothetical protein ACKO1O_05350 [Erythrobacter sp.]
MDVMKLFKSFEELLYEVIVILVFFPRTLWLTFRFPQRMMDYSDTELGDVQSEQYSDTLSPPLFLMLCVGLGYLIERAVPGALEDANMPVLLRNAENLVALRVLTYSLMPLAFSLRLMHRLDIALDRDSLRPPFFSQCFAAGPVAMLEGLSQALWHAPVANAHVFSLGITAFAIGWYLLQQVRWLHRKLAFSYLRGAIESTVIGALTAFVALVLSVVLIFSLV